MAVRRWKANHIADFEIRGNGFLGFCVHGVVVKKGFVVCNVFVCNVLTMMYFKSGFLRDARKSGLSEDVFVRNAIVDMNAKCELMDEVSKVSESMKVKDVVSWNAMVTRYSQVERFEDALSLFEMMKVEKRFSIDGKRKRKIEEDGFWLFLGDFCFAFS
ncbi:hypothetical protein AgCh_013359 [Apium graveolens]